MRPGVNHVRDTSLVVCFYLALRIASRQLSAVFCRVQEILQKFWVQLLDKIQWTVRRITLQNRWERKVQRIHHSHWCFWIQRKPDGSVQPTTYQPRNIEGLHRVQKQRKWGDSHWELGMRGFQGQCEFEISDTMGCLFVGRKAHDLLSLWLKLAIWKKQ